MATLRSLEKSGVLTLEQQEVFRRVSLRDVPRAPDPVLNDEQQAAFEGLDQLCRQEKAAAALLYGVTGSGKTQVYIRLIQQVLERGKSALVLVPEIALTPQLLRVFASHFGDHIAVLHSSLRSGERYDEWKRIRRGDARVVIGTRSAVFARYKIWAHCAGRGAGDQLQVGKQPPLPRPGGGQVPLCAAERLLLLGLPPFGGEHVLPGVEYTICIPYPAGIIKRHCLGGGGGPEGGAAPGQRRRHQRASADCPGGDPEPGRAGHPVSQPTGGQPHGLLRGVRLCARVPRCSVKLTYHSANHRLMCHHCAFPSPCLTAVLSAAGC